MFTISSTSLFVIGRTPANLIARPAAIQSARIDAVDLRDFENVSYDSSNQAFIYRRSSVANDWRRLARRPGRESRDRVATGISSVGRAYFISRSDSFNAMRTQTAELRPGLIK